jgi:adenylate kinase family enzyme
VEVDLRRLLGEAPEGPDRHLSSPPKIAVVGTSGSGKTTVARRLAEHHGVPHVELDALHWGPNWSEPSVEEFRARVERALSSPGWIADGSYHGKLGDSVLERADLVVWLDPPLWTIAGRIWSRTLRRIRTREELWGGNRESWRDAFLSRDSLFVWIVRTHRARRRRYLERLARYEFVHLRSEREIQAWLAEHVS